MSESVLSSLPSQVITLFVYGMYCIFGYVILIVIKDLVIRKKEEENGE